MHEEIIKTITEAKEPVYTRYGFGWKGAEWYKTTKAKLIELIKAGNYAHYDICDVDGCFGVNFYSANDMY